MPWEELLKQQTGRESGRTEQDSAAPQERETLIRQICDNMGVTDRETAPKTDAEESPAPLSDGYVRRTPVQKYATAPDYNRRRVGRAVQAVIVLIVLALLILALFKSDLIRWS